MFQLAEQRRRLGGADDSTYNVRDFLDDSASEVSEINSTWCRRLLCIHTRLAYSFLLLLVSFVYLLALLIHDVLTHSFYP
jgi:hypothetical protein